MSEKTDQYSDAQFAEKARQLIENMDTQRPTDDSVIYMAGEYINVTIGKRTAIFSIKLEVVANS